MKRIAFYPAIAVLAFLIGIFGAWFTYSFPKLEDWGTDGSSNLFKDVPAVESIADIEILPKHRFTETFRACKPGFVQGYVTDEGQAVTEGNNRCNLGDSKATEAEFNEAIRNATKIIERNGERVALEFQNEKGKYVEILQYNGGVCISFIHAPTLELALEFEKWHSRQK